MPPKAKVPTNNLRFKSPAEFFSENKNIAGFDTAGRSLYTTVREFVENSLDAAESVPVLPDIDVVIDEVPEAEINALIGVTEQKRKNEDLYDDNEASSDPKEKGTKKKTKATYYRVTCTDNGCGLAHDDIPNAFGRVLAGTKYGVRQTRGKFGLGAKMALIWSKMSTGLPITIESAQTGHDVTKCVLDIDIRANRPQIIEHIKTKNLTNFRGTKISVVIQGTWNLFGGKIATYMKQLAVITPHAQLSLRYSPVVARNGWCIKYSRRSDVVPPAPSTVKHHPQSVHLILVKQLLHDTQNKTLKKFLMNEFQCVNSSLADGLLNELSLDPNTLLSSLNDSDVASLVRLFTQVKVPPPMGDCLSPAGEYNLRLGIMKELSPTYVATYQCPVGVHEGHPFVVEAGVSVGSKSDKMSVGINVYRFANRIPLLFEPANDVATKTAEQINWLNYKIKKNSEKIGVFVSIVSTKIPFKGTGKEYIGDDCAQIKESVKEALTQCCLQLKGKLVSDQLLKARGERKKNLVKYVPDVSRAVFDVVADLQPTSSSIVTENDVQLLQSIKKGSVSVETFKKQLELYVEKTDADQALDFAVEQGRLGVKVVDCFLTPLDTSLTDSFYYLKANRFGLALCKSVVQSGVKRTSSVASVPQKKSRKVVESEDEFSDEVFIDSS
ncbi:hypothetical protein RCL1_002404 [Eukaryota sp. TZLM3-RCL]